MTLQEVMTELQAAGSEQTKQIWLKHGVREPYFGVKIEYLKTIQKRIKKDYKLSMQLYATGNHDAMYLAALIADETKMTPEDLQNWAEGAYWYMLSEFSVAWVASESAHGMAMGLKWIDSPQELIANAGWATLSAITAIKPDNHLDLVLFDQLLNRVAAQIHQAPNWVRRAMNGFVIAVGTYIQSLSEKAYQIAQQIGRVRVDMGNTACKIPQATEYIDKVKAANRIGKKRKSAKC